MDNGENKIPTQENLQDSSSSKTNSPQFQKPIIAEVPEESQAIPQKSIVIFPTVILLITVSVFAGYLLYQNTQLKKALKTNSFDSCAKEGGIIQESYPRVCVTRDGRRFTEEIKEKPIPIQFPIEENEIEVTPEEEIKTTSPTSTILPTPANSKR